MKKAVCLMIVLILALSLCVPAVARYDQCKKCEEGTFVTKTVQKRVGSAECLVDSTKTDTVYRDYRVATCNNCEYSYNVSAGEPYVFCWHSN